MHDLNTNAKMAIKWHKITHSSCKHRVFICLPKNCVCIRSLHASIVCAFDDIVRVYT